MTILAITVRLLLWFCVRLGGVVARFACHCKVSVQFCEASLFMLMTGLQVGRSAMIGTAEVCSIAVA